MAARIHKIACIIKIATRPKFISLSNEEYLVTGSFAFFIILQSCPTYTTIPTIQGVFFNLAPFNNNCLADNGIVISAPPL